MKLTARSYVWAFCLCLVTNIRLLLRPNPAFEPSHIGFSFYVLMNDIVFPAGAAVIILLLTKETSSRLNRAILILGAADSAMMLIRTFSQLGYLPFYVSPRISQWLFFIATVLLGYRMDRVLKDQNKRIETSLCSTLS
jgi:hypothetical protein